MAPTQRRFIRQIAQLFECELFDRPQHEEAPVLAVPQEVLVDQRLEDIELCGTDGFRRLELEAPGEHGQPRKQGLLTGGEELVAPLDGPAQRSLPLRCVVRAGRQQVQAPTEALEDLVRCEDLHARGSKLERQRKALEALGNLTHCRIGLEVRLQLPCALSEECRCVVERKRRHGELLFGSDIEAASARGEDARIEPEDDVRGVREELLEVVEHKQSSLARQELEQVVRTADHPRDRRLDQVRIAYRGERDEPHTVAVLLDALRSCLQRQPSLARAARAGERDDAMHVEQREHLRKLSFASDERCRLHRKVRLVDTPQRRELVVVELVEPFRGCKVLEPVRAEVTQAICAGEIARCLRDENLAAVTGSGDARSAMHVDPDVAFLGHHRLARVQSHAHSDRSVSERFARRLGRSQRVGRLRKRYEEGVSLCAYLDATMASELLAQHAMVLG